MGYTVHSIHHCSSGFGNSYQGYSLHSFIDGQTSYIFLKSQYQQYSQPWLDLYILMDLAKDGHFQTVYIQCQGKYKEGLIAVLQRISNIYATFKYLHFSENLEKIISSLYHEIKLTKRKIVFAVILNNDNPQACPSGSKRINLTDKACAKNDVQVEEPINENALEKELIKRFQLDSVWVGLLYRIGVDVEELQDFLGKEESFELFQVSFLKHFYKKIEERLDHQQFTEELLTSCKEQLQQQPNIALYNSRVEELIRSQFNSRIVLTDITNHAYLHLLSSRNYFNLIYIQLQIQKRFHNFTNRVLTHYPNLSKCLTFSNFIIFDDFVTLAPMQIYSHFIFGCLGNVKKFINRSVQKEDYSTIVAKQHKDIIRQFRPSYNQYFLYICVVLKERAACLKEAVGSIIVQNNKIISTGYNGTPNGTINCYNGGCQVCNNSEKIGTEVLSCRCIHAQYNCILKAGITATPGTILYSTKLPCLWCAKLIIQGRIKSVIYIRSQYSSLQHQNINLVRKTLQMGKVEVLELDIPFHD